MDYFITNDKTDFKNIPHRSLPVLKSPQFTTVLKGHHQYSGIIFIYYVPAGNL
jgi:hypothetical protein